MFDYLLDKINKKPDALSKDLLDAVPNIPAFASETGEPKPADQSWYGSLPPHRSLSLNPLKASSRAYVSSEGGEGDENEDGSASEVQEDKGHTSCRGPSSSS